MAKRSENPYAYFIEFEYETPEGTTATSREYLIIDHRRKGDADERRHLAYVLGVNHFAIEYGNLKILAAHIHTPESLDMTLITISDGEKEEATTTRRRKPSKKEDAAKIIPIAKYFKRKT